LPPPYLITCQCQVRSETLRVTQRRTAEAETARQGDPAPDRGSGAGALQQRQLDDSLRVDPQRQLRLRP
jgi:hypothetical protein